VWFGIVEGLTEFLPISSTGHLILLARLFRLEGEAVMTFTIVIQLGAVGAVGGLYGERIASMWRGLWGWDAAGRRLLINLVVGFLPVAAVGLWLHRAIKTELFNVPSVAWALALGGVLMLAVERWRRNGNGTVTSRTFDSLTVREACLIGMAQCLSLWPGTSRAMVTIVAGLLCGLPPAAAAEYSFLLALPTLGIATAFEAWQGAPQLLQQVDGFSITLGFVTAMVTAWLAVRGFVAYLSRRGLAVFGWYRIGLAVVLFLAMS
jgi:undecaprenyl-diphosphatase